MSLSKAEKKKLKRLNAERVAAGEEPLMPAKPKALRSQIAIRPSEPSKPQTRRKLVEIHPIDKAAKDGKLDAEEHNVATIFRVLCEKLARSGIDSTVALTAIRSGMIPLPWTKEQAEAARAIGRIECCLADWEYEILRKVCGEAWPISDAIKAHAICHEDGRMDMFRNTLRSLRKALTGARVPWTYQKAAEQFIRTQAQHAA